jgi:drug/metabolite transporter (DMT)-like permease
MDPLPFTLALAGAFVHATWNLLLLRRADSQAATAVALMCGAVLTSPFAFATWSIGPEAVPYVLVSAAIELVYFALLAYALQHAAFSVVYPLGRGLAPVIVLVVGASLLRQPTTLQQLAGIVLIVGGILLVRGWGRGTARARDVGIGLAIAAAIAAYTLVDQQGLRYASPLAYLWLIMVLPGVVYAGSQVARVGPAALRQQLDGRAALAGAGMFGSYALVLAALQFAPAAPVAAVREASVVIATLAAGYLGLDSVGPRRLAGSVVVVLGVGLLALAR